ncbi:hypothetical protein [Pontibacter sp. G13]|uniref:hypothetical protein n=1 Tax=Pontibacter sp. G13 TaxID=3074898 RepID=UPI00288C576F|nr:hypothetical protein [Pontibacter sp. G13]WNJ20159.1 hypothetical protein RJD25_06740 [Pontibacter sp. G13]
MQLIYDIVKKLKKQEIRQIRHQIKHASFEYEKMGKLFELVTRYDQRDEGFYSQKLYGKEPDNTFRVTKSRLKRMLENAILNDKSLTVYPPAINARLQVQKKLLQGEILLGRGAYLASKNLLLQVISSAQKYDLYQELFEAELLLYRNMSIRSSVKEFEKKTAKLLAYNQLNASINEAMILYYSISNLILNKKTLKQEQIEEVRETIDRMKEICETTKHPQVQNLYFLSEIYYLQIVRKYKEALTFCQQYLELVSENNILRSDQRLATAYGQLTTVNLHLGNLEEARKNAELTMELFSKEEMNYLQSMEVAFVIEFHAGNFEQAQTLINEAREHPEMQSYKLLEAKWSYFQACVYFKMEEYQKAYLELNHTTPLLADKYGFNLSVRLLEIMLLFELGHLDMMETKILNMRQFIKRTQKGEEFVRPSTLIRILIKWYKNSYDFNQTFEDSSDFLEKASQTLPSPYMPGNSEFIRLEEWMRDKRETQNA